VTIKKAKMARNSNPRPERVAAHLVGLSAESRAAAYLVAKGYRIVARRFRSPVGEIDIVARRRGVLVFVEVKARNTIDDAALSLLHRQQQRIAAAAGAWLAAHPEDAESDVRFDAVLVAPGKIPRHIPAAFETE
jgi:putative endonuclease